MGVVETMKAQMRPLNDAEMKDKIKIERDKAEFEKDRRELFELLGKRDLLEMQISHWQVELNLLKNKIQTLEEKYLR